MYFILLLKYIFALPQWACYSTYDRLFYIATRGKKLFYGWGIHLYTGKFGQGKTSLMTIIAYKLAKKFPQLTIITNIKLINFPKHTKILPLKTAEDILNAPENSLILIDEIGTLFNSRDFSTGKNSVPKSVFQHLCQCRKRRMMILATVQRFNLLDKQIRDITATVTACKSSGKHPFTRRLTGVTFDIDEYEAYQNNPLYNPKPQSTIVKIQKEQYRRLYDTSELIQGLLKLEYLSDDEIMRNRGESSLIPDGSKESKKAWKRRKRF